MNQLTEWWELLESKEKRNYSIVGGIVLIVIVIWLIPSERKVEREKPPAQVEVDLLSDDGGEADLQKLTAELNALKDQVSKQDRTIKTQNSKIQQNTGSIGAISGIKNNPEQLGQLMDDVNRLKDEWRVVKDQGLRPAAAGSQGPELIIGGTESNLAQPQDNGGIEGGLIDNPFSDVEGAPLEFEDPLTRIQSSIRDDNSAKQETRFPFGGDKSFDQRPPPVIEIENPQASLRESTRTGGSRPGQTTRDQRREELEPPAPPVAYLPTSTLMQGVLLNGMDAPTGSNSSREPYPVTIRLTSLGFLPNRYMTNLRECFVLAAGFGRLDSERVHLRTEQLSCVLNDGTIIDKDMDGYITGADGKTGLRGTVVERTGALLMRAALAGLGSGISEATQPRQIQSVRTGGQAGGVEFDAPATSEVLEIGAYAGVAKGLEALGEYYLERAEEIFPIIEIDAMTEVTIHLTKGIKLETLDDGVYGALARNDRVR